MKDIRRRAHGVARQRVTVMVSRTVLKRIDRMCGREYPNRSAAVEAACMKLIEIHKQAAGRGKR